MMLVTFGLRIRAGYSVCAQMLLMFTPSASWKTWTAPDAPRAYASDAALHNALAATCSIPAAAASTPWPADVMVIVTPPFAVAQSVAAILAWSSQ